MKTILFFVMVAMTLAYLIARLRIRPSQELDSIDVARGNDEWVNLNRAPRILRTQPAGSWTIETKILGSGANA